MPHFIKLAVAIALTLLASCAVQQTNLQRFDLANINHWNAKGKISVTLEGKRQSANFSWLNKGRDFDIRLHGPFGSGAANLEKRGDDVSYRDGKHQHQANSAEALLEEATGWRLPISELRWWIKALPSPESEILHTETTADGHLASLTQHGWHLRFKNYETVGGHSLPGKIIATRDDIQLTLAIKQWELKAPRK